MHDGLRERMTQTMFVTFNVSAIPVMIQVELSLRIETHDGLGVGLLRRCVAHGSHQRGFALPLSSCVILRYLAEYLMKIWSHNFRFWPQNFLFRISCSIRLFTIVFNL